MLTAEMDPQAFEERGKACIAEAAAALEAFVALPADASFAAVIEGFDRIARPLDVIRGPAGLASQTYPAEAVRNAAQRIEQDEGCEPDRKGN